MKAISFYNNNRSNDTLHIETEGCIVNIRVNLRDMEGREVTSVEIIPDNYASSYEKIEFDGTNNNRIIKLKE